MKFIMKRAISAYLALIVLFSASAINAAAVFSFPFPKLLEMELPNNDTSFKSFMDYRYITDKTSDQYRLQQEAYTDRRGIRRINGDVCIALGTAYSERCGIRFRVTLDSGYSFTAIVADIKDDSITDSTNRYCERWNGTAEVIEFVVDSKKLDKSVRYHGTVGRYKEYGGNIVSLIRIEETAEDKYSLI